VRSGGTQTCHNEPCPVAIRH